MATFATTHDMDEEDEKQSLTFKIKPRSTSNRTTESPSKKEASFAKDVKLPNPIAQEQDVSSEKAGAIPKSLTDLTPDDSLTLIISGSCSYCGKYTFSGVKKSLIRSCLTNHIKLLNFSDDGQPRVIFDTHGTGQPCERSIVLKSSENIPELMEAKDESDSEICDETIELREKYLALRRKLEEKEALWAQLERDYLLCIRAAERGRVEAVNKLNETEQKYQALLKQCETLRTTPDNSNGREPICGVIQIIPTECKVVTSFSDNEAKSSSADEGQHDTGDYTRKNGKADSSSPEPINILQSSVVTASAVSEAVTKCLKLGAGVIKENGQEVNFTSIPPGFKTGKGGFKEDIKNDIGKRPLHSLLRNPKAIDSLRKAGKGSLRNALLKWCQDQTRAYNVDITNFSSSWKNGLAAAALLHSLLPTAYNFHEIRSYEPLHLFTLAGNAAENLGVKSNLNIKGIISADNPHWEEILEFVKDLYVTVNSEEGQVGAE